MIESCVVLHRHLLVHRLVPAVDVHRNDSVLALPGPLERFLVATEIVHHGVGGWLERDGGGRLAGAEIVRRAAEVDVASAVADVDMAGSGCPNLSHCVRLCSGTQGYQNQSSRLVPPEPLIGRVCLARRPK